MNKTIIIGHRGAAGEAAENTLAAVQKAIDAGVHRVEIDVRLTADKKVVVAHDRSLRRISGSVRHIKRLSYQQLLEVDFAYHYERKATNEKIPLLEQVIELTKGKTQLLIEIKNKRNYHPGIEWATHQIVKDMGAEDHCIYQSFDDNSLFDLRDMKVNCPIHKLFATFVPIKPYYVGSNLHYKQFKRYNFVSEVGIKQGYVNSKVVNKIHQMGKKVNVWTVNKPNKIIKLASLGVDGIITDYPTKTIELLKNFPEIYQAI